MPFQLQWIRNDILIFPAKVFLVKELVYLFEDFLVWTRIACNREIIQK